MSRIIRDGDTNFELSPEVTTKGAFVFFTILYFSLSFYILSLKYIVSYMEKDNILSIIGGLVGIWAATSVFGFIMYKLTSDKK